MCVEKKHTKRQTCMCRTERAQQDMCVGFYFGPHSTCRQRCVRPLLICRSRFAVTDHMCHARGLSLSTTSHVARAK